MNPVFALVVCYFPDMEKLAKLVLAISPTVQTVMIINNGGADDALLQSHFKKAHIVSFGKNIGIAAALNYACDYAAIHGYRFFIGFDQDSRPGQSMVAQLATELIEWQARLEGVVAIGPKLVDVRGGGEVVSSFQRFAQLQKTTGDQFASGPVSQLITSGCMIDLLQWGKISRFNDQFFIDFVDHNWCWSLTRRGFTLIGAQQAIMQHELSVEIKKFFGFSLNTYSPIRRYYQARNAIYQLLYEPLTIEQRLYLLRSIGIFIASSICSDPQRGKSIWQLFRGIWHGVIGKLGVGGNTGIVQTNT